jgi:hypothetical protein
MTVVPRTYDVNEVAGEHFWIFVLMESDEARVPKGGCPASIHESNSGSGVKAANEIWSSQNSAGPAGDSSDRELGTSSWILADRAIF